MPFQRQRANLLVGDDVRRELERISRSRTDSVRRVERAKMLLGYAAGETVSAIARSLNTHRPKVDRCVRKALEVGALAALEDLPRRGRPSTIPAGSRAWLVALACRKPTELGYAEDLWTVAPAGRACAGPLPGGGASGPVGRGARHGVEDPRSLAGRSVRTRSPNTWSVPIPRSTRRWRRCCASTGRWR